MVIFKTKKRKSIEEVEEKLLHKRHDDGFKNLGTEESSSLTRPARPKLKFPLHNFELPDGLRWGNQKCLRCVKVDDSRREVLNLFGEAGTRKWGFGVDHDDGFGFGDRGRGVCGGGLEEDDTDSYYLNCEELEWRSGLGFEVEAAEEGSKVAAGGGEEEEIGIDVVRERVILDLQNAGDRMKEAILRGGSFEDVAGEQGEEDRERVQQPWNLRTRRAINRPVGGGGGEVGVGVGVGVDGVENVKLDVIEANVDELRTSVAGVAGETASRRRGGGVTPAAGSPSGKKKEREKFSVAIGRREIEEDFMALLGHKPPRRPKKRAKIVQKQLDTLFPGLWLSEITPDMYKVTDPAG